MDEKNLLRGAIQKRLKQVDERTHFTWSQEIVFNLQEQSIWKNAKTVGLTMPVKHEIDTTLLIKLGWEENKTIVAPACNLSDRKMFFREITSFHDLAKGYGGMLEPKRDKTRLVPAAEIDLIIVPGMLFDLKGYRLGYGKGFFDRYLTQYVGTTASLAFDFMLIQELPYENHDIPVGTIITNRRVHHT